MVSVVILRAARSCLPASYNIRTVVPVPANCNGDFSPSVMAGLGSVGNLDVIPSYTPGSQPWSSARPNCTITNGVLSQGCIDPNGLKYSRPICLSPMPIRCNTTATISSGEF
jgi:hypothetical protein